MSANGLTEDVHLRGRIHAVDLKTMRFQLTLPNGGQVVAPISKPHRETILEALNGFLAGTKVLLDGVVKCDESRNLSEVESVRGITILDPLDLPAQLDDLRALKDGWLDGLGIAPSHEGLDRLAKTFQEFYPESYPRPYTYPVPEGGVRFEWSIPPREISLDIDLDDLSGEWHSLDLQTDEEVSCSLNLNKPNAWNWLIEHPRVQNEVGA